MSTTLSEAIGTGQFGKVTGPVSFSMADSPGGSTAMTPSMGEPPDWG